MPVSFTHNASEGVDEVVLVRDSQGLVGLSVSEDSMVSLGLDNTSMLYLWYTGLYPVWNWICACN